MAEEFLGLFVVTGFQAHNEMFEWLLALRLILLDPWVLQFADMAFKVRSDSLIFSEVFWVSFRLEPQNIWYHLTNSRGRSIMIALIWPTRSKTSDAMTFMGVWRELLKIFCVLSAAHLALFVQPVPDASALFHWTDPSGSAGWVWTVFPLTASPVSPVHELSDDPELRPGHA